MVEIIIILGAVGVVARSVAPAFAKARKHRYDYLKTQAIVQNARPEDLREIAKSIFNRPDDDVDELATTTDPKS